MRPPGKESLSSSPAHDPVTQPRRGFAGILERSWSGVPGTVPWTRALLPFTPVYEAVASSRRARAARTRRTLPGCHVVAIGGLTVGGAGKSSLARWLASETIALGARPVVLLRGHGANRKGRGTDVVPDFAGYPMAGAVGRYGDEACAHRAGLPREATVAVARNRFQSARAARDGYGATVAILDDGWEQGSLQWNELWVSMDASRPTGNGDLLPAGPLRRPFATIGEAAVVALLLEDKSTTPPAPFLERVRALAPRARLIRFRRRLAAISEIGAFSPREGGSTGGRPAALLSGVGAPERLTRFARASGIPVVLHAAFPDHARWNEDALQSAASDAVRAGAEILLVTEKDEPRWPRGLETPLPVRVLRTSLVPLDELDGALAGIRAAVAATPRID